MIKVAELSKGQSFGELALLNNSKRAATVVAIEDCDFGVLSKENFEKVVGQMLRKKFEKKVEFLNKFSFLSGMTRIKKEKLWFSMKKQIFNIGQKVMIEGVKWDEVFFVEKGKFEITKTLYIQKARTIQYYEYIRYQVIFNL